MVRNSDASFYRSINVMFYISPNSWHLNLINECLYHVLLHFNLICCASEHIQPPKMLAIYLICRGPRKGIVAATLGHMTTTSAPLVSVYIYFFFVTYAQLHEDDPTYQYYDMCLIASGSQFFFIVNMGRLTSTTNPFKCTLCLMYFQLN